MDLPEVERVEAVRVEPGDVIVVTVRNPISHDVAEYLKEQLGAVFPDNQCVVVSGATLEITRPATQQEQDVQSPLAGGDAPDRAS